MLCFFEGELLHSAACGILVPQSGNEPMPLVEGVRSLNCWHISECLGALFWTCYYYGMPIGGLVAKSCPTLASPRTVAHQAPLSMGFSRQEYWSRLAFPSPGDLPNPGLEPGSLALQADSLPTELWGKPGLQLEIQIGSWLQQPGVQEIG